MYNIYAIAIGGHDGFFPLYPWGFFPVICDTLPDLSAKFQVYMNFFPSFFYCNSLLMNRFFTKPLSSISQSKPKCHYTIVVTPGKKIPFTLIDDCS